MAAKKKGKLKKAIVKGAAALAGGGIAPSPCATRGAEFPGWVYVTQEQRVEAFLQICGAAAEVVVSLHKPSPTNVGGVPLVQGTIPSSLSNPLKFTLPPLEKGHYLVFWTFAAAGPWEAVAEIHVDGVARFRKLNGHADSLPVNAVWADIEVTS